MLARLPQGALLLVVAGSPCQQLSTLGAHNGRLGLCGRTSSLFFVIPVVCAILQALRPDLLVHVLVENAGSMLGHFKKGILVSLNVPPEAAITCNTDKWTSFNRCRLLVSTLRVGQPTIPPVDHLLGRLGGLDGIPIHFPR